MLALRIFCLFLYSCFPLDLWFSLMVVLSNACWKREGSPCWAAALSPGSLLWYCVLWIKPAWLPWILTPVSWLPCCSGFLFMCLQTRWWVATPHFLSFSPPVSRVEFLKTVLCLFWFDFLVLWGGMVSLIPLFYFCVVLLEKSFMLMVFFLFLIFAKLLLMVLHVLAGFDVAIRGIRWPEIKPFFMVIFFPKHLISLLVHVAYLCTYISRGIMSCIKLYLICLDHV